MVDYKLENFFIKIYKNLNSQDLFYSYSDEKKKYSDCLIFIEKLFYQLEKLRINKRQIIYIIGDKSFEMYSSIIGVIFKNITWVPISPNIPPDKLKDIIVSIKPNLLICDENEKKLVKFFKKNKCLILSYKQIHKSSKQVLSIQKILKDFNFNRIAFIYFTSGSTGKAKGIKISYKNIIIDVYEQISHLYSGLKNKNLIFGDYYETSFSIFFDIFYPAIYLKSAVAPGKTKQEIFLPFDHIKDNNVNILICVPSTVQRIKTYYGNKKFKNKFFNIILTGEPLYLNLLKYINRNFNFKFLYNCYGGTEMSNWIFYHQCKKEDIKNFEKFNLVPIGKRFKSVKIKLNKDELIVSGPMISQGYIDKKLNYKKFEFNKTENTFFTGDIVKKHLGKYVCIGRKDNMVKIRGYRIEIPHIEAIIRKLNIVDEAVVIEKKLLNYENYLIGIIKLNKKIDEIKLLNLLGKKLEKYMLPSKFIFLKNLPLNENLKIDRKHLINQYG